MPGTRSPVVGADEETIARVAIVAALAIERVPLDASLAAYPKPSIRVYQCGIGSERAYDVASTALSAGASALVSWGIAGALVPELSPGTILLPEQVLTAEGEEFATDSQCGWNFAARYSPCLPSMAAVLSLRERFCRHALLKRG